MEQIQSKKEYAQAYYELYMLIKSLPVRYKKKIPNDFIDKLIKNMAQNSNFRLDLSKNILNQNYDSKTKALFIQTYQKYIAPESEKEIWEKYNMFCRNKINEEKRKKYSTDDIFKNVKKPNTSNNIESSLVEYKKESLLVKIKNFFKNLINKK